MLLSDRDIRAEITAGRVAVEPYEESMIQPSSVDVRLDKFFRVFENHKYSVIDPSIEQSELTREVVADDGEAFILHPGEFVLASTYEIITLPDDIAGRLEGKSSLGRLGLLTHSTAGFIDPGFSGHITLELSNVDLTQEFSDLILAQRAFQAGSRIITVSDSVMEEIVNLKR